MTIFKGEMPPNGISGGELSPVIVSTFKLKPPLLWAAIAQFADSREDLLIGTEVKFLKEQYLIYTLEQFYGLILAEESRAILDRLE
jgi:hypothetical protein